MNRPSWDDYFFQIARDTASRATCPRLSVGVVIVRDHRILAGGYNGSLPGQPHCVDVGCDMVDGHCIRTVHAESNAIAQVAKYGIPIDGASAYVYGNNKTYRVCQHCRKLLSAAGIKQVFERFEDADWK